MIWFELGWFGINRNPCGRFLCILEYTLFRDGQSRISSKYEILIVGFIMCNKILNILVCRFCYLLNRGYHEFYLLVVKTFLGMNMFSPQEKKIYIFKLSGNLLLLFSSLGYVTIIIMRCSSQAFVVFPLVWNEAYNNFSNNLKER